MDLFAYVEIVERDTERVVEEHEFPTERGWKAFNFYWTVQCDHERFYRREVFGDG